MLIHLQYIFHSTDKIRITFFGWKAPTIFQPKGLNSVFLSVRLTVSGLIKSTMSQVTKRSANNLNVQDFLPCGATEQAVATKNVSPRHLTYSPPYFSELDDSVQILNLAQ